MTCRRSCPAILKIAVEGTGAAGGRITVDDADAASVGSGSSQEFLVLPLPEEPVRADLILSRSPAGSLPRPGRSRRRSQRRPRSRSRNRGGTG